MFRPCIDLHEGKVKQIVGGTLSDAGARTNFVSEQSAAWFAELYRRDNLRDGHVIQLGSGNEVEARAALAVKELERTGAFSRKVLAVMGATGTGWIEPQSLP